jgi:hypothetical protein
MQPATSTIQQVEPKEPSRETQLEKLKAQRMSNYYLMFYRHGMNANLTKGFFCDGDLQAARKRAEAHCKIMGYKYIFVRPMICNLEAEEEYKLHGSVEGELIA